MKSLGKERKKKLEIELVPSTSFFKNLRSELSKEEWDCLRKDCYRKANYLCEICGGKGEQHPVECHEIWEYDDKEHIQKLIGLIALCPKCHQCKHIGLSQMRGLKQECVEHLSLVNGIEKSEAEQLIADAFKIWNKRSRFKWKMNLDYLEIH